MAGQVCFAHQIGQKGQEKLHNERHKWKLGGGGARITDVVLQSGWACSAVVQLQLPAPPPPSHQSQMDITQWSVPGSKMKMRKDCDNLREKRAEALFPRRRRRRRRRPLCQITRVLLPGTGLA